MSKNKVHINLENLEEWMCSTGFLLPRNETELKRFEKLYPKVNRNIPDDVVDPEVITNGTRSKKVIKLNIPNIRTEGLSDLKMVARNYRDLPENIIKKLKKNQEQNGSDTEGQGE